MRYTGLSGPAVTKVYTMNTAAAGASRFSVFSGMVTVERWRMLQMNDASSRPYSPKMAAEAPVPAVTGWSARLTRLAQTPDAT